MSNCVPYAIHIATGIDYEVVLGAVERHGWSERDGIAAVGGWYALRSLGIDAPGMKHPEAKVTLSAFVRTLRRDRNYIVDVNEHWFAVWRGVVVDAAKTHGRTLVRTYIELQP